MYLIDRIVFFYYVFARDFYIAENLCPLASRNYGFWCIFWLILAVLLFQLRVCLYVRVVRARVLNNFNVNKCCSLFYVEFLLFALVSIVQ